MRIISGKYRGKVIIAPVSLPVRPTTDYAKTGLFNILNNHIDYENVTVLDLYSGTGNIGYEFLSRGCKSLTMVDQNRDCVKFIEETLVRLNEIKAHVVKSEVMNFLDNCFPVFDLIFADPPFEFAETEILHRKIFENNLLNLRGMFILEHRSGKDLSSYQYFIEARKYGHVSFSFFRKDI